VKPTNWKDVAEFIGIAAIVASLIFVGLQLRQDFGIARSQVWSERNMLRAELASLITENPEVWTKGLNGDDLSEPETAQFEAIFVVYLFKESTHFLQRNDGISPGPPEDLSHQFASMIMTFPGLGSVWTRWVTTKTALPPFAVDVQRQLEEIKAGRIEPISINMMVPY
jgi:hypothetical protein